MIPFFSPNGDIDEEKEWRDAANMIQEHSPFEDRLYKMLQVQLKKKHRHLLNYDWIGWS